MGEMVRVKVMAGLLKLEGWGLRQHKCLHSACRDQSVQSQSASDQKPQLAPVRCYACVEEGRESGSFL